MPSNGTGDNFSNELKITFPTSSLDILDMSSGYVATTIQLTFYQADATPVWVETALPVGWSISNSAASALYSRSEYNVMQKPVGYADDYAHAVYYKDLITQSAQKLVNNNSSNPINLLKRFNSTGSTLVDVAANNKDSLGITSKAKNIFTLCSGLPVFRGKHEIPGNLEHSISLHVATGYENGILFHSSGALPAQFKGVTTGTAPKPTGQVAGDTFINVNVLEVKYNVMLYEGLTLPSNTYKFRFNNYKTVIRPISNVKEQINIDVPPNATDICAFFAPVDGYSNVVSAPNMFVANLDTTANALLESYKLKFDGNTYPHANMRLDLLAASNNRLDNSRAFEEFIGMSRDLSPNGSSFDFASFTSNFMIYQKLDKISNNRATKIEIQLDFRAQPVNSRLVVIYDTDEELTIEYDTGVPKNVYLSKII